MRSIRFLDFDLLIARGDAPGEYEARVIGGPSGEYQPVRFTMPFSALELENFLLKIGRRRTTVRGLDRQDGATVQQFGTQLFDRVFTGDLRLALATSLNETDSDDLGLRLRLRLTDCPELADLPWEYLYDKSARRFLALSEWTPVVRYLDLPGRVRRVSVEGPLRILGMASSPTDYPRLSVDDEWSKLHEALDPLIRAGRVDLRLLPDGTLASLNRELRRGVFHVFHYIGHGGFVAGGADGVLILEGSNGRGLEVSGQDLGVSLHDHRTLRLAVLNSCEGARTGLSDPYSGTAQALVQQGIPAVVAMQFEITDDAAITFSHALYEAIADGYPLDASMAEARKAVRNQPNATEWGTPVLYLRSPDGRIFDIAARVDPAEPALQTDHAGPKVATTGPADHTGSTVPTTTGATGRTGSTIPTTGPTHHTGSTVPTTTGPIERTPGRQQPAIFDGSQGVPGEARTKHRRRWIALAAVGLAAVVAGGAVAIGTRGGDSGLDPVLAAAKPWFSSADCEPVNSDNAPLASQLDLSAGIKCGSSSTSYKGTFWCTDSQTAFDDAQRAFLNKAVDGSQKDLGSMPAGSDTPADGTQQSYQHRTHGYARVFWDSPSKLCGAELQAQDGDVDSLVQFWQNGSP